MSYRRHKMMASKEKYEYITDGLVLHLDGKWNGGVGKHLDSTDTWVDLSPMGNDATSYKGGQIAFGKDYCHTAGTDAFISLVSQPACHDITIETWFRNNPSNHYAGVSCWGYNDGKERTTIAITPFQVQYYGGGGLNAGQRYYYRGTLTYNKANQVFKLYENGIEKVSYAANLTNGNRTIPAICIGLKSDTDFLQNIELYSVRVYDRTLSAEEIAYNAALDVKRLAK